MRTAHRNASKAKKKFKADPTSIYKVMGRVQPFTDNERTSLVLPVRLAFESIKTGAANRGDFETLAAMSNICLIRGEEIDPLCVVAVQRCQDGIMRCLRRFELTGKWGFDGPAIQEIEVVMDMYEQLLELSTPQQMKAAMQEAIYRMNKMEVLQ